MSKTDENPHELPLGQSVPAAGETQPPAESGAKETPQDIKGTIECVRPIKDQCGRLFLFRDGTRVELYDDGTIVIDPWDSETEPAKLEAITRWKKLRGWQPKT